MGTPDIAAQCLAAILEEGRHEVCGVFTREDKPVGRKQVLTAPPAKQVALAHGLPVFQPKTLRSGEAADILRGLAPQLIVVVAYGRILPPDILALPHHGCINLHVSLLPKYRGAAPIQWAVLNGEKTTGVTIQQMGEGLDTGDMLRKAETEIGENETSGELFDRLKLIGAELLVDTIDRLDTIVPEPQDEAAATHAPMIRKEMGEIDWAMPAQAVHNLVRGLNPWPAAFFMLGGKRMKLYRTELACASGEPGTMAELDGEMTVFCGEGAVRLTEIQPENGKRMRGSDYLRGHPLAGDTVRIR